MKQSETSTRFALSFSQRHRHCWLFRLRYGFTLVMELSYLTPSSALPTVYVHKMGFLAQSVGVAYYIWLAGTYKDLPHSSALTITLQSNVATRAFFENVFGFRFFACAESVIDGCGHLKGLGLYRNSSMQEAKSGAVVVQIFSHICTFTTCLYTALVSDRKCEILVVCITCFACLCDAYSMWFPHVLA